MKIRLLAGSKGTGPSAVTKTENVACVPAGRLKNCCGCGPSQRDPVLGSVRQTVTLSGRTARPVSTLTMVSALTSVPPAFCIATPNALLSGIDMLMMPGVADAATTTLSGVESETKFASTVLSPPTVAADAPLQVNFSCRPRAEVCTGEPKVR